MSNPSKKLELAGTWYSRDEAQTCYDCTRVMITSLNVTPDTEHDVKVRVRQHNGKMYLILRDPNEPEPDITA